MTNNDRISTSQIISIIVLTIIGTGILTLPQSLAEAAGPDGWIILIAGGLMVLLVTLAHAFIVKCFPGKTYLEIITLTLSKPVAYIYGVFLVVYLIILNGFLVRIFAEVVKMFLLFQTPIEIIIMSVLLVTAYLVRQGIETMGRLAELLLPIILIPSLILFALALQGADPTNILPTFQISPKEVFTGIPLVLFSFLGFDLLLIFGTFLNQSKDLYKKSTIGILIILALYLVLTLTTLLVFGTEQTVHLIWPTLSLFKTIDFPGLFIENVEAVVMAMWVFIVFMSVAPLYLGKTVILQSLFKVKEHNFFVLPIVPLVYLFSLLGKSMAESYYLLDLFTKYFATVVAFIFPALIILSILIQRRFKKEGKTNA